jgi:hypothetical protein
MNPKVFARFQTQLGPESVALWWTTTDKLHFKTDYLPELDYFFDGLITKSIRSSSSKSLENLFLVHHHFGKPLYLIYSIESEAKNYLKQSLALIQSMPEQEWIHPLLINSSILTGVKKDIEQTRFKLAPLVDEMSS